LFGWLVGVRPGEGSIHTALELQRGASPLHVHHAHAGCGCVDDPPVLCIVLTTTLDTPHRDEVAEPEAGDEVAAVLDVSDLQVHTASPAADVSNDWEYLDHMVCVHVFHFVWLVGWLVGWRAISGNDGRKALMSHPRKDYFPKKCFFSTMDGKTLCFPCLADAFCSNEQNTFPIKIGCINAPSFNFSSFLDKYTTFNSCI